MTETIKYPRTPSDFALIDRLVAQGASDEQIFKFMKTDWRSRCQTNDDGGIAVCTVCRQVVNVNACPECGQAKENFNE